MSDVIDRSAPEQRSELIRALGLSSLVLFGVSYMAPLIVLGTFGVIAVESGGAVPASYLLALVAMIFTALSYGTMARLHPVAGSAYTYVRKSISSHAGFLVGWAALLDYFFLPMVIWLIGASFLDAEFPGVPQGVWVIAFIVVTTGLNILGVVVAERASMLLMAFQCLVIVLFVALSLVFLVSGQHSVLTTSAFWNDTTNIGMISAGAAVAAYSFLGFDAVTTLAEEAKEPARDMPRAILLVALIGGGVFVVISYVAQVVHPGTVFADADSAAFEIAREIGGAFFSAVFIAGLVVTQFGSGIAAQASAARLTFAMGRDGVLPKRFFGFLHPRFRTPVLNILLSGVVGLIGLGMDVATSTSFINFGAFIAFTMVNVSVLAHYLQQRRAGVALGVARHVVAPAIGAVVSLYLLTRLDDRAVLLGCTWLVIGIVWLLVLTRGLRQPPPQMDLRE